MDLTATPFCLSVICSIIREKFGLIQNVNMAVDAVDVVEQCALKHRSLCLFWTNLVLLAQNQVKSTRSQTSAVSCTDLVLNVLITP